MHKRGFTKKPAKVCHDCMKGDCLWIIPKAVEYSPVLRRIPDDDGLIDGPGEEVAVGRSERKHRVCARAAS